MEGISLQKSLTSCTYGNRVAALFSFFTFPYFESLKYESTIMKIQLIFISTKGHKRYIKQL